MPGEWVWSMLEGGAMGVLLAVWEVLSFPAVRNRVLLPPWLVARGVE